MNPHCLPQIQHQSFGQMTVANALRSACGVMNVAYHAHMAYAEQDEVKDAIEILMVADHPVFYAAYRSGETDDCLAHKAPALCERDAEMIVIALDRVYFEHRARLALGNGVPKIAEGYAAADSFLREVGNTLFCDFREQRLPTCAYLESLAGVLAIHLATHHCERRVIPSASIGLPSHKLNRVLTFIHEHIAESIHIRHLAAMAHMSLHHFARMFKHATGVPPHLYITMQRIERAKTLLRESELPLVEVAAHVGFQTQGHFTAVFHRYVWVTPRAFRLNSRASLQEGPDSAAVNRNIQPWMRKEMEEQGRFHA
jgi:AraC family transcriptional regulator